AIHGLKVGDSVTLPGPALEGGKGGGVTLTIAGTVEDYTWNHGTLIIDRALYLKYWNDNSADVIDVYLRRNAGDTGPKSTQRDEDENLEARRLRVKDAIDKKLASAFDLQIMTRPELQSRIRRMIEQVYGIAYGQLIVVMIVASLGVVTALLISVLQRRREM